MFNEAIATNQYQKPGAISLLKRAIRIDSSFALAYFKLGEIYHNKAQLSKYDIKNQIHSNYYLRKASDNLLYAIELCNKIHNYLAYFYLGEQFYWQKEYSLSGIYLKTFIEKCNEHPYFVQQANVYYNNILQYKKWQNNPFEVRFSPAASLNTYHDELNPYISANGQFIYFLRSGQKQMPNNIYFEKSNIALTAQVGNADSLENWNFDHISPVPFNQESLNGIQYLSSSANNKLLFLSNFQKIKQTGKYYETGKIFYSEFETGEWEQPNIFHTNLNSNYIFVGQPCISNDGNTLFFTSNHPDGYGGNDIYYCIKDATGNWQEPINMGNKINTINNEEAPFIHYDNSTFYFISDGHFGIGGYDIFVSRKDESNNWGTPTNLGIPINSIGDERGISIDARGIKAYTCSNKRIGRGGWDIYAFDIPEGFRPNEMILLGGKVLNQDSLPAFIQEIEIIDLNTNDFYNIEYDEQSGTFSSIIPLRQTNYYIKLIASDYSFGNTIINGSDKLHTYFKTIILEELRRGTKYYLKHVEFDENLNYEIHSIQILADFARYLKTNNTLKINIIGADPNAPMIKNTPILTEKAKRTFKYLSTKGININRIQYKKDTSLLSNLPMHNPTRSEIIIEITDF